MVRSSFCTDNSPSKEEHNNCHLTQCIQNTNTAQLYDADWLDFETRLEPERKKRWAQVKKSWTWNQNMKEYKYKYNYKYKYKYSYLRCWQWKLKLNKKVIYKCRSLGAPTSICIALLAGFGPFGPTWLCFFALFGCWGRVTRVTAAVYNNYCTMHHSIYQPKYTI